MCSIVMMSKSCSTTARSSKNKRNTGKLLLILLSEHLSKLKSATGCFIVKREFCSYFEQNSSVICFCLCQCGQNNYQCHQHQLFSSHCEWQKQMTTQIQVCAFHIYQIHYQFLNIVKGMTHLMSCFNVSASCCVLNPFLESFPRVGDQLRLLKFPLVAEYCALYRPTFRRICMYVPDKKFGKLNPTTALVERPYPSKS